MNREGLGDLKEPDQLQPVQTLGSGLIAVDLRQPGIHGRIGNNQPVDVREPEVPPHRMHRRAHRRRHQTALPEMADIKLNMGALNADEWVESVGLAPPEPPA